MPIVETFQHASYVGGLMTVQEKVGFGRVGIAAILTLEHSEGHKQVKEIATD